MPIIQISMIQGRTLEQKRKLVEGVTQVVVETTGAPADAVTIIIQDLPVDGYAKAGKLWQDLPPRK